MLYTDSIGMTDDAAKLEMSKSGIEVKMSAASIGTRSQTPAVAFFLVSYCCQRHQWQGLHVIANLISG
jgi:hypothetical protein